MKMTLLAVGSKMPRWVDDAFNEYARRLPREAALHLQEIKPEKRGGGVTAEKGMAAECARIEAAIPPRSKLIVLDERGQDWTSVRLASEMKTWLESGDDICLVIGGADGLSPAIKQRADVLLRLSALTLPHGMVRVLLAEQLYRAVSILNNHPYHRE
ncbi:23S rRNA (pseudouridine(1915)-N(3))-methyltransferase RlmH [Rivihabitans pingtungensis]|jgi:23S rRNA (pseudouridine1915-N3)-methyltransferase|uniref:Ribosomal RNA large subunit methyltransferase H n=1 Tax=Rivihabitans pingtungensis TaxID=1054498 RepID=A0A318KVB6_9NEIS|nr:23S rRNA (pseudouridine(1915)-N(3))-methyltransferase RlmH [Rivihabitans pingtungensis]MCK6438452.1 23S rRNA (pseudouridine(1915)-N(3))-methyltransferase RlmH [Rivihabitans pingtungensis]PXX80818.1 23S rRNA (pseudouridine1915-N3)-methyltransferase [Rivihabitans pingtungensis]HNX71644.1 23S rRNA (pseudouridine(1915)-N(3))-methyltransferase RlmH [Rivihabitans pingtungensis]